MKRIKKRIKKIFHTIKFRSIYIRWTFLFMGIILASYYVTVLFVAHKIMPRFAQEYQDNMKNKAEFIQALDAAGFDVTEETLNNTGDPNFSLVLFDAQDVEGLAAYREEITLNMLIEVEKGTTVTSRAGHNFAFCLFKIDGGYALLEPNATSNDADTVIEAFSMISKLGTLVAAVLIVFALIIIIRPINKVISATEEVASGNFDVHIPGKTGGDIGRLIQNFNYMAKSLYKNEYLKKDFVSNVSHEFKTPITSIEGFARLLQDDALSAQERREYTDIIIKESARLSQMAGNLLKLSELDSREFTPERTWYDLDEQLREIVLLLENLWSKKNITFDLRLEPVKVYENEELLHQVWYNLIHNAIKFSYDNAVVTIELSAAEDRVLVAVKDNGPGMRRENAQMVFERFYQADASHATEGSGLGLSIVKRIVDIVGGSIACESDLGRGAAFTVTLYKQETEN